VKVVIKGYGAIKLVESGELVQGEITLYEEGWVAVGPAPGSEEGEVRWFPNQQVEELVWRKSLAIGPRRAGQE